MLFWSFKSITCAWLDLSNHFSGKTECQHGYSSKRPRESVFEHALQCCARLPQLFWKQSNHVWEDVPSDYLAAWRSRAQELDQHAALMCPCFFLGPKLNHLLSKSLGTGSSCL